MSLRLSYFLSSQLSNLTHDMSEVIISHLFGKARAASPLHFPTSRWRLVRSQPLVLASQQEEIHHNQDLVGTYRHHILNNMNQFNLQLYVKSYDR